MDIVDSYALLAADVAAPVEDTVTLFFPFLSPRVVPAAAAQEVAAVDPVGSDVADPVAGPKGACLRVGLAKIWRVFIVNQVLLSRGLEEVVFGPQGLDPAAGFAVFLHHHLGRAVVFVLEVIANDPEVRLGPPAGLDLTAAREPVALALEVHELDDGLQKRGKAKEKEHVNLYILLLSRDFPKNCEIFHREYFHSCGQKSSQPPVNALLTAGSKT